MEGLNGMDYRATARISDNDNLTLADVGETCERVPADSLGWLLDQRLIELIAPAVAPIETAVASPVEARAEGDA